MSVKHWQSAASRVPTQPLKSHGAKAPLSVTDLYVLPRGKRGEQANIQFPSAACGRRATDEGIAGEGPRMSATLARRDYIIKASQQRVWDVLPSTIIQCMPVEQMDIVNDSTFVAVLKMRFGFVEVPFRLRVQAADISPIGSLTTVVTATKSIFQSSLRVSFALAAVSEDETSVACTATEDSGSPWMWLLKAQQRSFAGRMFDAIRDRLESSC
jgi:carbon monoxide dehydrogenase subunit G